MKLYKLLATILSIATLFSASSSYAEKLYDGHASCENSYSSIIYGSAAMSAFALALVSLNFSKWCKHKDETIQKESEKKIEKSVISKEHDDKRCKHKDELSQNETKGGTRIQHEQIESTTETKIEKSVIPEKHDDKKGKSVSKVSVNQTERRENWIKILSGETIENGDFRYKSGAEFRRDNDENLEKYHDFIQVFFPNYVMSRYANPDLNINACRELWEKVATEESQATITRIQREMRLNFIRMLLFWGFSVELNIKTGNESQKCVYQPSDSKGLFENNSLHYLKNRDFTLEKIYFIANDKEWVNGTDNHNRLRITRVLMALKIFGLDNEFDLFRQYLLWCLCNENIKDVHLDKNECDLGETGNHWNDTDKTKKLSDVLKLKLGEI